jgi:hypothetical protein
VKGGNGGRGSSVDEAALLLLLLMNSRRPPPALRAPIDDARPPADVALADEAAKSVRRNNIVSGLCYVRV